MVVEKEVVRLGQTVVVERPGMVVEKEVVRLGQTVVVERLGKFVGVLVGTVE